MLRKKLLLGILSATVVSSLAVSQVQAATTTELTGETNVTYKAGTVGPTDPIDPSNPENDKNNWIVYYPKTVTLNDNNKVEEKNYKADHEKGKALMFKVKQAIQGTDGKDEVNEDNIGAGIQVKATAEDNVWINGSKNIKMTEKVSNSEVTMGLGNENELITKDNVLLTLTTNDKAKNGYAVLTNTDGAVDGLEYTTKLTFKFERKEKPTP